MADVKHTPGPWWFEGRGGDEFNIRAPDGDDTPWEVAHVAGHCGYGASQSEANARLIAAAPELLEALQEASEWIGILTGQIGDIDLPMSDERDPRELERATLNKIAAAIAKATAPPEHQP